MMAASDGEIPLPQEDALGRGDATVGDPDVQPSFENEPVSEGGDATFVVTPGCDLSENPSLSEGKDATFVVNTICDVSENQPLCGGADATFVVTTVYDLDKNQPHDGSGDLLLGVSSSRVENQPLTGEGDASFAAGTYCDMGVPSSVENQPLTGDGDASFAAGTDCDIGVSSSVENQPLTGEGDASFAAGTDCDIGVSSNVENQPLTGDGDASFAAGTDCDIGVSSNVENQPLTGEGDASFAAGTDCDIGVSSNVENQPLTGEGDASFAAGTDCNIGVPSRVENQPLTGEGDASFAAGTDCDMGVSSSDANQPLTGDGDASFAAGTDCDMGVPSSDENQPLTGDGDASFAAGTDCDMGVPSSVENQPLTEDRDASFAAGTDCDLSVPSSSVQNELPSNCFLKVLQHDLVSERLLTFLNFEDIKALSEASTASLQAVRKTKYFSNRARLRICQKVISNQLLKECTFLWKHLVLDLSIPMEILDVIGDMMEVAESIFCNLSYPNLAKNIPQYLEEILRTTKNLKTFGLTGEIMERGLYDVFSNIEVQAVLKKLQCLVIYSSEVSPDIPYCIGGIDDLDDNPNDIPFIKNLFQLSLIPLQLKKFVFGRFQAMGGSESEHAKYVPNIICATKDTLEDLEVNHCAWKFKEMETIRCPKLKRLTLTTEGREDFAKIVDTFIKNQPPLEELSISLHDTFPARVLYTLQSIGRLVNIKKLRLKAKRFDCSSPIDWRFLNRMTKLKEFALRKPNERLDPTVNTYGYGEDILNNLPEQTESISLQGFTEFWQSGREDEERNIGTLISRFENLSELNLLRSQDAITDIGLQSIIANCPKLVSLTFSHCPNVSDFGISGVPNTTHDEKNQNPEPENIPVLSLDQLKYLKELKIRSCPNITPECLLGVVKFPHLESFDYYRNIALRKEFLLKVVQQNPCLEKIALHIVSYDHDHEYLETLKKEVKEINKRVHFFELLEKSDWEDHDSDSDASSLERFGYDSDISGHGGGFLDYMDDYDSDVDWLDDADDDDYDGDFEYN